MATNRVYNLAVIPGDGIGKEVMPEGVRVLEAAAKNFGFELRQDHFDFATCDYYDKHGRMMPEDWKEKIGRHDAIFFGAVGWPAKIPDHISLWGSLILFRREFDQYVNLRPVRLMPGVPCPLANRKPGDIDFFVVRENTEGEYSSDRRPHVRRHRARGRGPGNRDARASASTACSIRLRARAQRPKKHLTSATKSNGIAITMPYWDERVEAMATNFPDVKLGQVSHRHSHRAFRAAARPVRRRRRLESVRRHPVRSRPGLHRHHRHRAVAAISIRSASFPRCSSRCTARRRTSPARASPIRSARSGPAR